MTTHELCIQWRRFLEGDDQGAVFDDEMLDHVEACDACQRQVHAAGDPAALWRRLATEAGQAEAVASEHLTERYSQQNEIEIAVKNQLIPSLSERVRDVWRSIDPLALFRGIDAVALLVRAFPDPDEPAPDIVLRHGSNVWIDDTCAIPRSTIEAEVARSTSTSADGRGASGRGVMSATTVPRFVEWLPQAARDNENLFLGIRSTPRGAGDANLTIVERDNATNLDSYWLSGSVPRSRTDSGRRRRPLATGLALDPPNEDELAASTPDGPDTFGALDSPPQPARTTSRTFRASPISRDDHHRTPTKPLPTVRPRNLEEE